VTESPDIELALSDAPNEALRELLGDGVSAFNVAALGPSERRPLLIALRARADGKLLGGLHGRTGFRRLFVELLFVPAELRGQGLGSRLLQLAEAEARARGCVGAWIETFSADARRVYERNGYRVFGEIADYPPGNTRYFLSKDF
jgi:GNAT superfamily N-acetyltransferase